MRGRNNDLEFDPEFDLSLLASFFLSDLLTVENTVLASGRSINFATHR